jgi:hypothetical protein
MAPYHQPATSSVGCGRAVLALLVVAVAVAAHFAAADPTTDGNMVDSSGGSTGQSDDPSAQKSAECADSITFEDINDPGPKGIRAFPLPAPYMCFEWSGASAIVNTSKYTGIRGLHIAAASGTNALFVINGNIAMQASLTSAFCVKTFAITVEAPLTIPKYPPLQAMVRVAGNSGTGFVRLLDLTLRTHKRTTVTLDDRFCNLKQFQVSLPKDAGFTFFMDDIKVDHND